MDLYLNQPHDPNIPNSGHGHVFPRTDGMRSRCLTIQRGCPNCLADLALKNRTQLVKSSNENLPWKFWINAKTGEIVNCREDGAEHSYTCLKQWYRMGLGEKDAKFEKLAQELNNPNSKYPKEVLYNAINNSGVYNKAFAAGWVRGVTESSGFAVLDSNNLKDLRTTAEIVKDNYDINTIRIGYHHDKDADPNNRYGNNSIYEELQGPQIDAFIKKSDLPNRDKNWWKELGKEGEQEYLRDHPNSKKTIQASVGDSMHQVLADMGGKRIYTAVSPRDIPAKLKDKKIIGRGSTSIVLDDGDSIIMLTRDKMKSHWFTKEGIGAGKNLGSYKTDHENPKLAAMPIHVLKMPKMHELDKSNKKLVHDVIMEYKKVFDKYSVKHGGLFKPKAERMDPKKAEQLAIRDTMAHFANNTDNKHILHRVAKFLQQFDPSKDYYDDLAERNFMQDKNGKIVAVDLTVSKDLLDALQEQKEKGDVVRNVPASHPKAADWWAAMSKPEKQDYLKEHPRSKFKIAAGVLEAFQ